MLHMLSSRRTCNNLLSSSHRSFAIPATNRCRRYSIQACKGWAKATRLQVEDFMTKARNNLCKQLHLVLSQELKAGHPNNLQEVAVLGAGLGSLNDKPCHENRSIITFYEVDGMMMSASI
jgi:hypothetical protein